MADKHFWFVGFLLLFKISDFSLFLMQKLRSLPPTAQKSHPLFSSYLPIRIEILSGPFFKKIGRRHNPAKEREGGEVAHYVS